MLAVGSAAMLRVSELSALCWRDIEADGEHTVTIRRSKTALARRSMSGAPTVTRLDAWRDALASIGGDTGPAAFVFVRLWRGKEGRVQSWARRAAHDHSIRRIIAARCAAAGIKGRVSGHSRRDGAASLRRGIVALGRVSRH